MRRIAFALAVLGLLVVAAPARANDAPANATPLQLGVPVTQSTVGSTAGTEPGTATTPAGCARMGRTVWFRLRGTGHSLSVSTTGSSIDTVVSIYSSTTPTEGNRAVCSDDVPPGNKSLATVASTVRGNTYLVQVGSKIQPACTFAPDSCANAGNITVTASGSPRPSNDDRAAALTLTTGVPLTVDNTGATSEPGEVAACGTAPFAATVWFRWIAAAPGTPRFDVSAGKVATLYRGTTVLACGTGGRVTAPAAVPLGDTLHLQVGSAGPDTLGLAEGPLTVQTALAQLDADADGFAPPRDCDDANPAINPGAVDIPDDGRDQNCDGPDAVDLDRDGDGVNRPSDCRDDRRDIHPGAVDVPQDGINQDCLRGDAPFPRIATSIAGFSLTFPEPGLFTRFTELKLRGLVKGQTVRISCRGRGCPRGKGATRKLKIRRAQRVRAVLGPLADAKLRRGAVVEVRVTAPRMIGRVTRWKIRPPKAPRRTDLCLQPGKRRPGRC